jgi:C4-dicarboxylate-specific signal transduction histidine kinase
MRWGFCPRGFGDDKVIGWQGEGGDRGYRTLSTAGITAATFAHESDGNPIKVITQSIAAVERRGIKALGESAYNIELKKPVTSIKKASESLAVLGHATLKLVEHEKRRPAKVMIHSVIKTLLATFQPFLEGRDVDATTEFVGAEPFLLGSEAAVESIITNLLNNSFVALEKSTVTKRQIVIRTQVNEALLTLRVLDNGPGIEGVRTKDIWLPGVTTRQNGTGLGLTIVRDAVIDLGGTVDAVEHGELGGAELIINLPILGA